MCSRAHNAIDNAIQPGIEAKGSLIMNLEEHRWRYRLAQNPIADLMIRSVC